MALTPEQTREIEAERNEQRTTRRVVSPGLEEMLFRALPVLDHGFVRVIDYMGDDNAIVQAARWMGAHTPTLSLYCQGLNQSSNGTAKNAALIGLEPPIGLDDYLRFPHVLTSLRETAHGVVDDALAALCNEGRVRLLTPGIELIKPVKP